MALLIDFSPIKSGGGAQLALNFIDHLAKNEDFPEVYLLVSDKFPFLSEAKSYFDCIVSPSQYYKRVFFENYSLYPLIEQKGITKIYTFFGPGLPRYKDIKQIVSVAYPIICYDESVYWANVSLSTYVRKKLINFFRKKRLKNADVLIFETEIMRSRCVTVLAIDEVRTHVVAPTPTAYLKKSPRKFAEDGILKILILSGLDSHKNLWRLIEVVRLAEPGQFKFVVSTTKNAFIKSYENLFDESVLNKIDCFFEFIGTVPASDIQKAYDLADVLMNISDLESFSNNYMEAWLAGKPIIASDRDFSRHICGGSAIYVDPHDALSVLSTIEQVCNDRVDLNSMRLDGQRRLHALPSLRERVTRLKALLR